MSEPAMTVLLVDPDARSRSLLASQLSSIGCDILEVADGAAAWTVLESRAVKVVVTELYLMTGDTDCLIKAVRAVRSFRNTRTVAHTHRCLPVDRDWAMTAGADAYLIKPTRAERMRYVVSRLATTRGRNAAVADKVGLSTEQPESPYRR
ncbi:MAG: response regulator [Gemmatimonadaceae bacterium]